MYKYTRKELLESDLEFYKSNAVHIPKATVQRRL